MTIRSFVFLVFVALNFLLLACGTDSDNSSDTGSTSSGADTSGSSGADSSGASSGDTSGATTDTFEPPATIEACTATPPTPTKTELSYVADIKPILERANCLDNGCHTPLQGVAAGDLDLSTLGQGTIPEGPRGPVFVPCEPLNSNIIAVTYPGCMESQVEELRMPQSIPNFVESTPLTADEAALLFQWIAEGGEATFNADTCP